MAGHGGFIVMWIFVKSFSYCVFTVRVNSKHTMYCTVQDTRGSNLTLGVGDLGGGGPDKIPRV